MTKHTIAIPLHPSLALTLGKFTGHRRYRAIEIVEMLGDKTTAATVHNRLERLRRFNLLDREHKGHGWLYFRKASK